MILKFKKNTFLIIAFFIILFSIISALIIEYILGYQPCKLCIYERFPYFLSALLIIKIIFFKKYEKIVLFLLFLIFIFSSLLAFYHFGIEQGFFSESFVCEIENLSKNLSKEQILQELKQKRVSCKDAEFKILGLSLALINTIFSTLLSIIFLKLFIDYGSSSTSQYK